MSVDLSEFNKFAKKMQRLEKDAGSICEAAVKELGGRFLALVIPETPLGKKPKFEGDRRYKKVKKRWAEYQKHWDGYVGGTLKRGWLAKTYEEAASGEGTPTAEQSAAYIKKQGVTKSGHTYSLTLLNPVKYAPYVEYGHRQQKGRYVPALQKRLVVGFAPGKFFLKRTIIKLRPAIPAILNKRMAAEIKKRFDNG